MGIAQATLRLDDAALLGDTASRRPAARTFSFANQASAEHDDAADHAEEDLGPHRPQREPEAPSLAPVVDEESDDGERTRRSRAARSTSAAERPRNAATDLPERVVDARDRRSLGQHPHRPAQRQQARRG